MLFLSTSLQRWESEESLAEAVNQLIHLVCWGEMKMKRFFMCNRLHTCIVNHDMKLEPWSISISCGNPPVAIPAQSLFFWNTTSIRRTVRVWQDVFGTINWQSGQAVQECHTSLCIPPHTHTKISPTIIIQIYASLIALQNVCHVPDNVVLFYRIRELPVCSLSLPVCICEMESPWQRVPCSWQQILNSDLTNCTKQMSYRIFIHKE